jgi:hypothetical protein
MAAAVARNISFLQAMGGQTTGNNPSTAGHMLEYANYKRALEPFWSTTPVYVGMGNHEGNYHVFAADSVTKKTTRIDQFPYETGSGEAAFARSFVNPTNGPDSEDGASYDPNPKALREVSVRLGIGLAQTIAILVLAKRLPATKAD